MLAAIFGCEGLALAAAERAFFAEVRPWGFILFARNCQSPTQLRKLVGELRQAVGFEAPILIDQEGGRVVRLSPPQWPSYPPAAHYGRLWALSADRAMRATFLGARLIAQDLTQLGVNVDCLPVADVPQPGSHDIIGDRAYAADPHIVATLARCAAEGLMAGGVLPVLKHIPGHGRARVDSHLQLPVVEASYDQLSEMDFKPFRTLNDLPMAMTAHVLFTALDETQPATLSPQVINSVIRGAIGFAGLLMTDDISMRALGGSIAKRCRQAQTAGCDVILHCNGILAEMVKVAENTGTLRGEALNRARKVLDWLAVAGDQAEESPASMRAEWAALIKEVA